MYKLICLFATIGFVAAFLDVTPVRPCYDGLDSVVITTTRGVCTAEPCPLPRNTNVTAAIAFLVIPNEPVDNIHKWCRVVALGIPVNFTLPNQDKGCENLSNTVCPLQKGETAILNLEMPVKPEYPKIKLNMTFSLSTFNENRVEETLACFNVLGEVVD